MAQRIVDSELCNAASGICLSLSTHTRMRELPGATAISSQIQEASSSRRRLIPLTVHWKAAVTFCALAKNECHYFPVHPKFRNSAGLFALVPSNV
jgi:hypothetical protein